MKRACRWSGLLAVLLLCACAHDPYGVNVIDLGKRSGDASVHEYRVRKGDTLYSIAFGLGLTTTELARINGIEPPYTIYPGQTLLVRGAKKTATAAKPAPKPKTPKKRPAAATAAKTAKKAPPPASKLPAAKEKWLPPLDLPIGRAYSAASLQKGIDYFGRFGQPVRAAKSGRVVYAGDGLKAYGLLLIVKHNEQYLSAYAYNRKILVKEGELVKQGQVIAEMGKKGDKTLLHFQIRKNGKPVNPALLLGR